jgi:hypothetical protein
MMIISRLPALTPWLVKRAKLLGYQMTQISFLKAAARPLLMEVQIKNSTMPLVRRSRFFFILARLICTRRPPLLVCMLPAARELI